MRTLAALDLRKVGLADLLAGLGCNALHQLLLREGAIEAAKRTLDFAQVTDFLPECHNVKYSRSQLEYRNMEYHVKNCIRCVCSALPGMWKSPTESGG